MARADGSFVATWGPGSIDLAGQDEIAEAVDAALRDRRIGGSRDTWLAMVERDVRAGGHLIDDVLSWPAGEAVRASWPGDNSAADNSDEAQDALFEQLYPSTELAAAVDEFRRAERGRAASQFANWSHRFDNSLSASSAEGRRVLDSLWPGGGR